MNMETKRGSVVIASILIIAVAAILAAFAYFLSVLLWKPGCCCCCGHNAAPVAAKVSHAAAMPPAIGYLGHDEIRDFIGEPSRPAALPQVVERTVKPESYSDQVTVYHAPVDQHPFDLPPGAPAFIPPKHPTGDVGPPGYFGPSLPVDVPEPSSLGILAAGVSMIALMARFKRKVS